MVDASGGVVVESKESVLSRGAINLLARLLSQQAWYNDTKTAYIAGKLLVEKVDSLPGIRDQLTAEDIKAPTTEELRSFFSAEFPLELNRDEIKVCVQCVEFFTNKGAVAINAHLVELMEFLSMNP